MTLDKSLWYPEVAQHGYFLEEDGIHKRTVCLGISPEDIVSVFKDRGIIPKDAELCPEPMPDIAGEFLVAVRHGSFKEIEEGYNMPMVRLGDKIE